MASTSRSTEEIHRLGMHKTPERNAVLVFVCRVRTSSRLLVTKDSRKVRRRVVAAAGESNARAFPQREVQRSDLDAIREIGDALAAAFSTKMTSPGGLPEK